MAYMIHIEYILRREGEVCGCESSKRRKYREDGVANVATNIAELLRRWEVVK